jgi:hypothetical protein
MTPTVMAVVLLAALLHAGWNFLVKSSPDKALSMTAVVLGHAPFALVALAISPWPRPAALPYLLAGAGLHVGYQLFLLASYAPVTLFGDHNPKAGFSTRLRACQNPSRSRSCLR